MRSFRRKFIKNFRYADATGNLGGAATAAAFFGAGGCTIGGWKRNIFMILENIQDPGNLGTILRAGEGAGISGVIMTKESADIFNPKVIRSTMGSIYRVPFYIVGQASEAISLLQQYGTAVYAADLESQSVDYDKKDYTGATAFFNWK